MRGISIRSIPTTTRPDLSALNSGTYISSDSLLRHRMADHLVPIEECAVLGCECARQDCRAHDLRLTDQEPDVVDGAQLQAEDFVGAIEVMKVSGSVVPARVAIAFFIDRPKHVAEMSLTDVDSPVERKERRVASQPGRQHTIKHVDPLGDTVPEVFGRSYAHQVPRLAIGQVRHCEIEELGHNVLGLADAQPADRASSHVSASNLLRALGPQLREHTSLDDAEEHALLGCKIAEFGPRDTSVEPAMRPVHGLGDRSLPGGIPHYMVERHQMSDRYPACS